MTDQELIEFAAIAVGVDIADAQEVLIMDFTPESHYQRRWNPLENDGDAMRLVVDLFIKFWVQDNHAYAEWHAGSGSIGGLDMPCARFRGDKYASARRVITMAAAEIGKQLKEKNHA